VSLRERLASGSFAVTAEISSPRGASTDPITKAATLLRGWVDAVNVTDNQGSNVRLASWAGSLAVLAAGLEPVMQMTCRDRNRIALQSDLLGAAALGIRTILVMTGDHPTSGDHPGAKPVFDLEAISLLRITEGMRDLGAFASGRKLETSPNLFLGATANPFVPPFRDRISNLEKKVDAGAQFIQTQFCFDVPMLANFMDEVRTRELHKRCAIIIGVGMLSSAKSLRRMVQHVPGVHIPEPILQRIGSADNQKAEAKAVLVQTMQAVSEIEGVTGVHLMGYRNDDMLAEAIVESEVRRRVNTRAA